MGKAAKRRRQPPVTALDIEGAGECLGAALRAVAEARAVRDRLVVDALRDGESVSEVARRAGISRQAVMKIRDR